jgi:ferrous iron transport protein B
MDEAKRHGLQIDERRLARDLGVPVVPTAARQGHGLDDLLQAIEDVATGRTVCRPYRIRNESPAIKEAVKQLTALLEVTYPDLPNARWVALRLLDGDQRIIRAIESGEFGVPTDPALIGLSPSLELSLPA